ncbi:MAG: hypothetical protein ACLGIG_12020, partial [Actinomycetes bacterium]
FSLKSRTAAVALSAGLALSLAACGSDDSDNAAAETEASASPTPVAAIDSLTGEQTAVTLDPAFLEGLTTLQLTPGFLGGAEFDADAGKVAFPITGGDVTYFDPSSGVEPYVQGEILHEGSGLSLTGGDTTVELTDFVVDPANSVLTGKVTANGEVAAESAPLFFLDGRTLNPLEVDEASGTAVLEGTTVSLTQEAADLLNATFGTDALTEFFPVGVAEITVKLPA